MAHRAKVCKFKGNDASAKFPFYHRARKPRGGKLHRYLPFDDLNVGPSEYMHCVSLVSIACNRQKISKLAHACLARETSSFARKKKEDDTSLTNELFRASCG